MGLEAMMTRMQSDLLEKYTIYSKDKKLKQINWPIPVNVEGITPPKTFALKGQKMTFKLYSTKKAKAFIEWALTELSLSKKEFYSTCRRMDVVKKRSLIVYVLRCEFGVPCVQAGEMIGRNVSQIPYLQMVAIREYGEELKEVGDLIKKWREYDAKPRCQQQCQQQQREQHQQHQQQCQKDKDCSQRRKNLYLSSKQSPLVA